MKKIPECLDINGKVEIVILKSDESSKREEGKTAGIERNQNENPERTFPAIET